MILHYCSSAEQPREAGRVWDRWQAAIGVGLGALTLIGLALLLGRQGYDDPYITYRYASNLLSGQGLVYNAGQQTLSTTAPLYAFLLAGLGLLWPDLPTLSNGLSILALILSAAIVFRWAGDGERTAGAIAALLLALSPLLLETSGAETCLYLFFILAGFYAYDRSHLNLAAGALAVAAMIRPDGVLAAVAVGLYHLLRRARVPWQPVALYAGLVGAWYGGLWLGFGSPLPVTLLAKQQQGRMVASTRFGPGLLALIRQLARQPLYWVQGALALVGIGRVATKGRAWAPLLLWTAIYLLAYTLLGVSRYFWYYAPLVPAFVVLVAEGTVAVAARLAHLDLSRPLKLGLVTLLLLTLVSPLLLGAFEIGWEPDPRLETYRQVGQWLEAHTPAQASVGALEVGIIGYYSRRPMIDFAGLIQPEVARHLTDTGTYGGSAEWAIQQYRPDYVVLQQPGFSRVITSDWFQTAYAPVREFGNEETLWLTLYRRSQSP
jgi:hypothetical protein